MNFLAHTYLSFRNPDVLVGNLIADFVKGKQIENFPTEIQQGIRLHRQIDEFTDNHPVTKATKGIFRASAGRYDATFLDMAYDHFLALDRVLEPEEGWLAFTQWCYSLVEANRRKLPDSFLDLFKHMESENWLYNYRYTWMMKRNFDNMKKFRTKYLSQDADIYQAFIDGYEELEESYRLFFPELIDFTRDKLNS